MLLILAFFVEKDALRDIEEEKQKRVVDKWKFGMAGALKSKLNKTGSGKSKNYPAQTTPSQKYFLEKAPLSAGQCLNSTELVKKDGRREV